MSESKNIRILFFDLGGVLFQIDHSMAIKKISHKTHFKPEEIASILNSEGKIIEYELGWISTEAFFNHQKDIFHFSGSWEELQKIWCDIFKPIHKNLQIVRQLSKRYQISVLSNTCEVHVQYLESHSDIFSVFHNKIYSFRVGYMKPRREIFEFALKQSDAKASECLLIDDTMGHIEEAQRLGFHAVHVLPGQKADLSLLLT